MLKKSNNKVIFGVVASFAEHFKVDVFALRIIVVLITVFTGIFPMVIVYLVCALLMPKADAVIREVEVEKEKTE